MGQLEAFFRGFNETQGQFPRFDRQNGQGSCRDRRSRRHGQRRQHARQSEMRHAGEKQKQKRAEAWSNADGDDHDSERASPLRLIDLRRCRRMCMAAPAGMAMLVVVVMRTMLTCGPKESDAASHNLQGRVQGLAHEMGPLGSALGALGPYGLAAAAGLAVVTLGLEKSIEEAMQAEKSYNRLQAVLTATGQSSGLTARQIVEFSDGIEKSALVTAEQVQDAAAALATFRSVAGDSFTRALRLAQDMSAVFGQDLHSSVVRLGRALEDPVEGLTALRRVGVVFTQGQREVIKSLAETGQIAEAQKVILDALEAKVGGAGAAEASGVTGASHRLAVAWKNMLESIGQTSVVSGGAEIALRGLSATLEGVTDLFKKAPLAERLTEATAELAEAQRVLERLQNYKPRVMTDMTPLLDRQKEKIADLRREVEALTAETRKETEAEAQAAAGRAAAEKDHRAELLTDQRKKLDDALDKLVTDPAEKIAKINAELATTKQRLENLREKDNSNATGVDTAIKEAEELARRQIEAVEKPALEAAKRASEANAKVVGDLQRQLLGLGNARQAFIDQAVSRLSDQAGDAERTQTRKLAAQLFDQKAFAEAQKVLNDYGRHSRSPCLKT